MAAVYHFFCYFGSISHNWGYNEGLYFLGKVILRYLRAKLEVFQRYLRGTSEVLSRYPQGFQGTLKVFWGTFKVFGGIFKVFPGTCKVFQGTSSFFKVPPRYRWGTLGGTFKGPPRVPCRYKWGFLLSLLGSFQVFRGTSEVPMRYLENLSWFARADTLTKPRFR